MMGRTLRGAFLLVAGLILAGCEVSSGAIYYDSYPYRTGIYTYHRDYYYRPPPPPPPGVRPPPGQRPPGVRPPGNRPPGARPPRPPRPPQRPSRPRPRR